jgi:hypothetical protein
MCFNNRATLVIINSVDSVFGAVPWSPADSRYIGTAGVRAPQNPVLT